MDAICLTRLQARRYLLAHQGLFPPQSLRGKEGLLQYIRRVNCVQFDPVDVTGRNHELVLQARVEDFSLPMLYEALYQDRMLVDGFDKNMCVYPTEDWPYFRRTRADARRHIERRSHPVIEVAAQVHREIEERGPLSSADLDMEQSVRWPWGPTRLARAALEGMYFWGELVIHHKSGVRKTYDLAERHIPRGLLDAPEPNPSEEAYQDWHVHRRLGSVGLLCNRGADPWLGIEGTASAVRARSLQRLKERGQVLQLFIEGLQLPAYMRSQDMATLESALSGGDAETMATVLAPLDNLLWDRRLARELFGFDYTWEVYVPPDKRRYGYYVLPVLYGDRFVARFEPVKDRKAKAMVLKNWWWEESVDDADATMRDALVSCLERFMRFLECDSIRVEEPARAFLPWVRTG